jgi:tetratricopeptide (TPR) repeat protein
MPTQLTPPRPRPRSGLRPLAFLLAAVVVAAVSYAAQGLWPQSAAPEPRTGLPVPGAPAAVDPDGAGSMLDSAERIAFWAGRVREQPNDFLSWTQLAIAQSDAARLTADLDGYDRASAAVEKALALVPHNPTTIRVRASIRFALHDFPGAVADAGMVLDRNPSDAAALAVLGDAQLELGRVDAARTTYDQLAAIADGPALDVRMARLAYLTGDGDRAVSLARLALDGSPAEPVEHAFYEYALGEYLRLTGDGDAAAAAYRRALALRPDDIGALTGLARVDAAAGRVDAALARLDRAAEISPHPELLALAGDLRSMRGDDRGAERAFGTVRVTKELASLAGTVYDRQLVLFDLDHGAASDEHLVALRAALADRPDAVGHDLTAWAAYRIGDLDLARVESDLAMATGIRDARILFHAGAIATAGGEAERGTALLEEALALGPALDPLDSAEARRLLGDGGRATAG